MHPLKNLNKTDMLKRYMIKFIIRLVIFIAFLGFYLKDKELLIQLITYEFALGFVRFGVTPLHVLWAIFMVMLVWLCFNAI